MTAEQYNAYRSLLHKCDHTVIEGPSINILVGNEHKEIDEFPAIIAYDDYERESFLVVDSDLLRKQYPEIYEEWSGIPL